MSWARAKLQVKLRGAELNLEEELKKKPREQSAAKIRRLKEEILDMKNQLKN